MPPEIIDAVSGSPVLTTIVSIVGAIYTLDKAWFHSRRLRGASNDERVAAAIERISETLSAMRAESAAAHGVLSQAIQSTDKTAERIERKLDAA